MTLTWQQRCHRYVRPLFQHAHFVRPVAVALRPAMTANQSPASAGKPAVQRKLRQRGQGYLQARLPMFLMFRTFSSYRQSTYGACCCFLSLELEHEYWHYPTVFTTINKETEHHDAP